MTITQYNSNNSLTPEFKWTSFEKINNSDELIDIPTKAKERSMIQISFRTQDPNVRQAQSAIRVKNYNWSTIHCVFKIRQSARFAAQIHNPCNFRAKSSVSVRAWLPARASSDDPCCFAFFLRIFEGIERKTVHRLDHTW